MLSVFESVVVAIELPQRVTLEVVETEPVTKGQTASSSYKPAKLSNGVRTNVPPFIGPGTRIVVMTEDGSYVERERRSLTSLPAYRNRKAVKGCCVGRWSREADGAGAR